MIGFILVLVGLALIFGANVGKFVHLLLMDRKKSFLGWTAYVALMLAGVGCIGVNGAFYYAQPGYNYLVQYPWGKQIGETTPGYHLKFWGTSEPFKKFITVKASVREDKSVSAWIPSVEIRFTDSVVAMVDETARFELPTKPEEFRKLAVEFRNQDNLETSTLIPIMEEVLRNSGRTMTAQDYIAGKGGEFENAILDQLRYGTYLLDITEIRPEGKTNVVNEDDRGINQSQLVKYEVRIKTDENGEILRKPTALTDYHIRVSQANTSKVDPEKKFKDMLALQRDAAAQASVKKQEAKRAEYDKQKVIAEGETEKAQIRVDLEKQQIQKLIAAETQRKEASIALETAEIDKKKVKINADARKIAADAAAYEKKAVILADGALTQKLDAYVKTQKAWADAYANRRVPATMIGAGSGTGTDTDTSQFQSMLNALIAKQLAFDPAVNTQR